MMGLALNGLAQGKQAGRRGPMVGTALGLGKEVGRRGQLMALPSQPHPIGPWLQVGSQCPSLGGVGCPRPRSGDHGPGPPQRLQGTVRCPAPCGVW